MGRLGQVTDIPASLSPSTDSPFWRGAVSWVAENDWFQPWRVLPDRADRAHAPALLNVAQMAAGIRVQLRTDASAVVLPISYAYESDAYLDVMVDGDLHARLDVTTGERQMRVSLPEGMHDVQIWLPQAGRTRVGALQLRGATTAEPLAQGPRWTTYGSSITQCSAAYGPSQTWPALVSASLGWDLTCLGYSGQCHVDPIAARTIAAVPADIITLCLGINIHNAATFNERSFAPHVSGFIEQVRAAHPRIPVVVMTPIASPERETTPNTAGLTLAFIRQALVDIVTTLQTYDADLHLVDGRENLGAHEAHLLPDGLHPDGQGYELMGQRIGAVLRSIPVG